MLERSLTRAGVPIVKHDIWQDEGAAAVVRSHADGTETVPTVLVGDTALVNPSGDEVIEVLVTVAPHLVPAGWEPGQPGLAGSLMKRLFGD